MTDNITLHKSDCALLIGGYQCTCGFHQRQNKTPTALAAEQPKQEAKQEPVAYFDLQKQVFFWAKPTQIDVPMIIALEPLPLFTAPPDAEVLRRDAERYRYLRDKAYVWDSDMPKAMRPVALWLHADGNANIDAAIDAAMKEDKT